MNKRQPLTLWKEDPRDALAPPKKKAEGYSIIVGIGGYEMAGDGIIEGSHCFFFSIPSYLLCRAVSRKHTHLSTQSSLVLPQSAALLPQTGTCAAIFIRSQLSFGFL